MERFEHTHLWRASLAERPDDAHQKERERLRGAYKSFRDKAALLVAEIPRWLPPLTVHDVTHLDALWEMADLIAGPELKLNPAEAFVWGGAVLIHDAGMALVASPGGVAALRSTTAWQDAAARRLRQELKRAPTASEVAQASEAVAEAATQETLRGLHAERAQELPSAVWTVGGEPHRLLEETYLRENFGTLIGRIAHSHWWPIERLEQEFPHPLGALGGFPAEWRVDALKLACLLRAADAIHLDDRRAPSFLQALRQPEDESQEHWTFQRKLAQPFLESSNRLSFTSASAFQVSEAGAWWQCYNALRTADAELRRVDETLSSNGRERFDARGVARVESPEQLATRVRTQGWEPVEARLRVGDVVSLVRRLGGRELYGAEPSIPLRELIQNSADAVRARRLLQGRAPNWGDITIRLGQDEDKWWIEVEDNGVGMSSDVLKGPFLDFGTSFWHSDLLPRELPGLASRGFEPSGRYGIGFFSVFMWGERVQVTTRRYRDAESQTRVLEFPAGLTTRPLLRDARPEECLLDGGTRVRVWLDNPPHSEGGLLWFQNPDRPFHTLADLCPWLCPVLDVSLSVQEPERPQSETSQVLTLLPPSETRVLEASDWISIEGAKLLARVCGPATARSSAELIEQIDKWSAHLRPLTVPADAASEREARVVGRAAILPRSARAAFRAREGIVTAGMLRAQGLYDIAGVLLGEPNKAARDAATALVPNQVLAAWATEQAKLLASIDQEPLAQQECAAVVAACGGRPGPLKIGILGGRWVSQDELAEMDGLPSEILFTTSHSIEQEVKGKTVIPHADVMQVPHGAANLYRDKFLLQRHTPRVFSATSGRIMTFPEAPASLFHKSASDAAAQYRAESLQGLVIEAVRAAWERQDKVEIETLHFTHFAEREVGTVDGQPLCLAVSVLRRG